MASDSMPAPRAVTFVWPSHTRRTLGITWTLSALLVAFLQWFPRMDNAVRLLGTGLAILVSVLMPLAIFCLNSPRPRWQRVVFFLAPFTPVFVFLSLYRITNVTGSLEPQFRWRWSDTHASLPQPAPVSSDIQTVADLATTTPDDYPQFLGPNRDQTVDGVTYATNWNERPPRQVWRQPIGAGWSSFAAVNGYAVTQEQREEEELVSCYEIATGKLLWAQPVTARHDTFLGGTGPRSTPTIHEGRVYALGATCILRCLQGNTGEELWRHDLAKEFQIGDDGGVAWGRSPSPLIVDELLVLPVGGAAGGPFVTIAAWDRVTGELRWKAGDRQTGYASPTLATLNGVRQILLVAENQLLSVSPQGDVLWTYEWPGNSTAAANVTNAVAIGQEQVFVSKGYGAGAAVLRVHSSATGTWQVDEVWRNTGVMKTKFSNVIVHENCIFGLDDVMLECLEIETGRKRWKHRGSYGFGQIVRVGPGLMVMGEDGRISLFDASSDGVKELGQFAALDSKTWNNPCIYGRFLLVRNSEEAACYELPDWKRIDP